MFFPVATFLLGIVTLKQHWAFDEKRLTESLARGLGPSLSGIVQKSTVEALHAMIDHIKGKEYCFGILTHSANESFKRALMLVHSAENEIITVLHSTPGGVGDLLTQRAEYREHVKAQLKEKPGLNLLLVYVLDFADENLNEQFFLDLERRQKEMCRQFAGRVHYFVLEGHPAFDFAVFDAIHFILYQPTPDTPRVSGLFFENHPAIAGPVSTFIHNVWQNHWLKSVENAHSHWKEKHSDRSRGNPG